MTLSGSIVSKCIHKFYNQKIAFPPQSEFTLRLFTTKELRIIPENSIDLALFTIVTQSVFVRLMNGGFRQVHKIAKSNY
jgi:hypothetical protein